MKRIALNILVICLMTCTSVMAQERSDAYFDQMAGDVCACMDNFMKLQEKAILLAKDDKKAELEVLLEEMKKEGEKVDPCINSLMIKYPDVEGNKEYEKRAEKALKKNCPILGGAMGDNGNSETSSNEDIETKEEIVAQAEDASVGKEYENLALDICDCMDKEPKLKAEFEALKAKGDKNELNVFRRSLVTEHPGLIACFNETAGKYPQIIAEDSSEKKLKALRENCPSYLELLQLE